MKSKVIVFLTFLFFLDTAYSKSLGFLDTDSTFTIESTYIKSDTPKDTYYIYQDSSVGVMRNVFSYTLAGENEKRNISFEVKLSNKFEETLFETLTITKYVLLDRKNSFEIKFGTLKSYRGFFDTSSSLSNPSIILPQGVYNINSQNGFLDYMNGVSVNYEYLTDNYTLINIVGSYGKNRILSKKYSNYLAYGQDSEYTQLVGDGKDFYSIEISFQHMYSFIFFVNYMQSSVEILPKKYLTQKEMYDIYTNSPNTATFLMIGSYEFYIKRFGFSTENSRYGFGTEKHFLTTKGSGRTTNSEGFYYYLRLYLDKYNISPYYIHTSSEKEGSGVSNKDTYVGLKYFASENLTLLAEYHWIEANSWIEAIEPTESALYSANNVGKTEAIALKLIWQF